MIFFWFTFYFYFDFEIKTFFSCFNLNEKSCYTYVFYNKKKKIKICPIFEWQLSATIDMFERKKLRKDQEADSSK